MLTTQCIKATSSDRHGVSNYRPIECLFNSLFRLPTKKYQRSALLSLCDENPLWSVVPHTKRRVTWKMLLFDDVLMDWRIPCIILRNIHIALQPLTKQCLREVGMLASRWFLCYRWVRFLRTITPSVKSNVTTALLGVEGGHPRWQRD